MDEAFASECSDGVVSMFAVLKRSYTSSSTRIRLRIYVSMIERRLRDVIEWMGLDWREQRKSVNREGRKGGKITKGLMTSSETHGGLICMRVCGASRAA